MNSAPNPADDTSLVRFRAFADLNQSELGAMIPMLTDRRRIKKGNFLQREGDQATRIYLLLSGWTASSISMPDGERQILKVHMAGDLVGLPSLAVEQVPDTVVALTEIEYGRIDLAALGELFRAYPRVAALLFLISQEERLMLMDRLTLVGRRDTAGGLAGMFVQLRARLLRHDPSLADVFHIPLTQADLADLIGVSSVHINRILTSFRKRGILTWTRGKAVIHDLPALRQIAGLPERVAAKNHRWIPESR